MRFLVAYKHGPNYHSCVTFLVFVTNYIFDTKCLNNLANATTKFKLKVMPTNNFTFANFYLTNDQ